MSNRCSFRCKKSAAI